MKVKSGIFFWEKVGKVANLDEDSKGDLIVKLEGQSSRPVILVAAHMDEVGFQVSSITPRGFLEVVPLGMWYPPDIVNHVVSVRTSQGDIVGVFGARPPYAVTTEERTRPIQLSQLYVDVGATDADSARHMGIQVGDHIVPEGTFRRMSDPNRLMSKAWDDRVGCALIAETIERLSRKKHPSTIYAAWTAEEEIGRANATVDIPDLHPDLVIVVEVGITVDTPDAAAGSTQELLGAGPSLDLYDGALVTIPGLRDWMTREAWPSRDSLTIYDTVATYWRQQSVRELPIYRSEYRYLSAASIRAYANGIIDLRDYLHTRDLLLRLLSTLDEETWKGIIGKR